MVPRRDLLDRLGTPRPGPDVPSAEATFLLVRRPSALVRLGLTPILVLFGLTADRIDPLFWVLVAGRAAWVLSGLPRTKTARPRRYPLWFGPVIELCLLSGMCAATGGVASPISIPLLLIPITAGLIYGRTYTAAIGALLLLAFALPATPDVLDDEVGALAAFGRVAAGLAFTTAAGVLLAQRRKLLTRRAADVDRTRRRMLSASLTAEDEERRRVSESLSGDALEGLLAAAQDADEAAAGDREALVRAREGVRVGVARLRATVRDLHPAAARHVGLPAALRITAEHRLGGDVRVTAGAGVSGDHDDLLLTLTRTVAEAAAACTTPPRRLAVHVTRCPAALELVLALEAPGAPGAGLGSCRELVEAAGGTLQVARIPPGALRVHARLPVAERTEPTPEELREEEEQDRLGRLALAWLNVLAGPVGLIAGLESARVGTTFVVLVGAAIVATVAGLVLASSRAWRRYPPFAVAALDMAFAGVLFAVSGGADTGLRALTLTYPLLLAFLFPARRAVVLTAILAAGFVLAAADQVVDGDPGARGQALAWLVGVAWAALAGAVLQRSLERVEERTEELEHARRRVLRDGLDAADRERRRLSERLHDEALQTLMVCGQELDEALDGEPGALARARAELTEGIALLRDTAVELHPPVLERDGLRAALLTIGERGGRRGGFAVRVDVAPTAIGRRDGLVIALVRELVTNAAKHADARHVEVRVTHAADWLGVEVRDDGVGMAAGRPGAAIAAGHIGLASARERVEAEGGRLAVDSTPGGGTRVSVRVPD